MPEPTPRALPNGSSTKRAHGVTKFGVVQTKATRNITHADPRVTDPTLGVIAYDAWTFLREIESPEWQSKLHDPRAGVPTDLVNVSATLTALQCHEAVPNVTSFS